MIVLRLLVVMMLCLTGTPLFAETSGIFVPGFWDPHKRLEKPDLGGLHSIHFLTEEDYPPFHFTMPDGSLAGFDVDLARAVCEELKLACTIQQRRFDLLFGALENGEGDALIAPIRIDAENRAKFDFTAPYYTTPARFVARGNDTVVFTPEGLAGKDIGVVEKSAHEAYLAAFFPDVKRTAFKSRAEMRKALQDGQIAAFFDDGIASELWLLAKESNNCCAFRGGPFTESYFFGEGVGIAVKKGNYVLLRALDYALATLAKNGTETDLYLKYFPLGFY